MVNHVVVRDIGKALSVSNKLRAGTVYVNCYDVFNAGAPFGGMPVGVIVDNTQDTRELEADLPRLGLVVLQFPKWVDGRAYSQAHLLRSRYRFTGEVRAIGQVLVDMLPLLQRTGFDAVVLRADQSREAAERALNFFPGHYQGDVREHRPIFARPADELASDEFINAGASI